MIKRRSLLAGSAALAGLVTVGARPAFGLGVRWDQLEARLAGDLVLPSDAGYAEAKLTEVGNFDSISPKGIAYCANSGDVALCVKFAQDNGLAAAVRSGGHSYGGYSTGSGLVIDVSRLNQVTAAAGSVTIGPGARGNRILDTLSPLGLQVSEGGCPTVAAGGFLQGGGAGYLTPSVGMACDSVTKAQVVLASGRVVTASAHENPDLFWALRGGGGGNFGVVTAFTVKPQSFGPMPVTLLSFPYERAVEVLTGFSQWMVGAPNTIGGGCYVIQPDAGSGAGTMINAVLASRGTQDALAREVTRLLSATGPVVGRQDTMQTYQELMNWTFSQTGTQRPVYALERSRLISRPPSAAGWDAVLSAFDSRPQAGQVRQLDLHIFGGVANSVGRSATAYVHRDSIGSIDYRTRILDPAMATGGSKTVARTWVDAGFAAVNPHSNGETYHNYMDPALTDWQKSYYAENYSLLRLLKVKYDLYRFFTFPQAIGS